MRPDHIAEERRGWSLEALHMLERSLDHMIGNPEAYMSE